MYFNQSNSNLDYDLVIVGGGIVGTTLAAALKDSDLRIAIIEALPLAATVKRQRAYALSLLSGGIFTEIGVWPEIFAKIANFSQISLSDADYQRSVQFNTRDLNTNYLGYVAEHEPLLTTLQAFVQDCPHIQWLASAEVLNIDYQQSKANLRLNLGGEIKDISTL